MEKDFDNNDTLLAQWLSGELKGKALELFEASEDFKKYKKIADATATLKVPTVDIKGKLAAQKKHNESLNTVPSSKTINFKPWLWSAAAAIAIIFVGISFINSTTTISTALAQTEIHILPDGSEIILNAASSISYQKDEFLETRMLELEGEAYFKVQKGSTFTVKSPNGSVQVLGTAFNVYDRKTTFKVHCDEGKVKVASGSKELILEKNMAAFAKAKTPLTLAQNNEILPTWQSGKSTFTKASLEEVFSEMERQFSITIDRTQIDETREFIGFFAHQELDKALYQVCAPMNIQYEVNENTVILSN